MTQLGNNQIYEIGKCMFLYNMYKVNGTKRELVIESIAGNDNVHNTVLITTS